MILHVRPKEVDEPVAQEDSQQPATEASLASASSSSPAPFVVPPIEQEHLDKALPVSLVTERTKVKLLCTPETYGLHLRCVCACVCVCVRVRACVSCSSADSTRFHFKVVTTYCHTRRESRSASSRELAVCSIWTPTQSPSSKTQT